MKRRIGSLLLLCLLCACLCTQALAVSPQSCAEELSAIVYGMDIFSLEKRGLWSRENEEHIEYAHTTEKLRALLEAAGFGDVAVRHDCPQGDAGRIFITAKRK